MASVTNVPSTSNQDVNGLLSGIRWSMLSLTFSFPNLASFYGSNYGSNEPLSGFEALNTTQRNVVRDVFTQYAAVSLLMFTEVTETATSHATLRFAMSNLPSTAWAYYPSIAGEGGDAWFRNAGAAYDSPQIGNYSYHTFLHEIGHAVGLKHGQDTSAAGAMTFAHDSMEYSVMTYRAYVGAPLNGYANENWGFAQSLMIYDIAALQYMYGANFSTNSGNTTYRWSPTTGEMFVNGIGQGVPGANRVFVTVWDGNGVDTYDFSGYGSGVVVDLRPGAWTFTSNTQLADLGDGHDAIGNIANALLFNGDVRSLIENAIGGIGADTLFGNEAGNALSGGGGNDRLNGGLSAIIVRSAEGLTLAQLDGVGGADLIQLGDDGFGYGWLSNGTAFAPYTKWGTGFTLADKIGDFNGDGRADVIQLHPNGNAYGWLSNGSGFRAYQYWGWGFLTEDQTGDFNGDGRDDVIQLHPNGNAYVWLSNGTNLDHYQYWGWGFTPDDKIGDFNGDGKDDVIQLHPNGNAYAWLSNGSSFGVYQYWGWGFLPEDQIGDFNGDGSDDVIQLHPNGNAYVWLSNGTNLDNYQYWGWGFTPDDKIGDFNGDGRDDIIQLHPNGNAYGWFSNGSGFGAYQFWGSGFNPNDQIGDVNNDGRDDVFHFDPNGSLSVMLSNGNGLLPPVQWGIGIVMGTGSGNDTLTGGAGNDLFVMQGYVGNDVITDFQPGLGVTDQIQMDKSIFRDFAAVLANTQDNSFGEAVISYGGSTVTLLHVSRSALHPDDFLLV